MSNGSMDYGRLVRTPRLVVGLAIALFGVLLVLDRANLTLAAQVLRFWPAVLIVLGASIFAQSIDWLAEQFRALGKRPTSLERKARTAERHRLLVPTRIALVVAVVVLAYFLIWPMIRSLAGS